MDSPIKLIKTYASFVKFAHTVFALPFALVGMIAAYAVPSALLVDETPPSGHVLEGKVTSALRPDFDWRVLGLILTCMVAARSFAMALNRIIDRKIDAANPRTAQRELPTGRISQTQAWAFALFMGAVYFACCAGLGRVVLALSPIPLLLMAVYPLTKRFTALCHLVLGLTLGLAPIGAWVAVRAAHLRELDTDTWSTSEWRIPYITSFELSLPLDWLAPLAVEPWLLGAAVMLWVAGFDVIYALQDDEFDREHRLRSIPARFGRRGALWLSRAMHMLSAVLFFGFVWLLLNPEPVGGTTVRHYTQIADWVWAAPCVMLAGMIYQHSLVRPNDLRRVNLAFFTVNGVISVAFGAVFLAAYLLA
jgi:4-hydroxybenzoate polyprenyltransferase